ncbi:ATP-binding cassette domain-containing protein [Novosphingobium sp. MW5]|nr:ATP-binding cassette domain-containing protein [Novosphingobium sp. MW5]
MIYQMADTALNPKIRISDIIGRPAQFYSGLHGAALKSRVDELLDLIELEPSQYYSRYPPELSGGQKQRVGIARALAAEPSFIICDEVTSALDQLVAEGILKLLDRLQQELNLAYMFITHDLATVRSIADEVVVMQKGRVVEQGPKDEMFTPPHHPYHGPAAVVRAGNGPELAHDAAGGTRRRRDRRERKRLRLRLREIRGRPLSPDSVTAGRKAKTNTPGLRKTGVFGIRSADCRRVADQPTII